MPVDSVWPLAGAEGVARAFEDLAGRWETVDGELTFDFSGVRKVDVAGLRAMSALAAKAADGKVKIALKGVNVDVYKALKLVGLTTAFVFPV